MGASIRRRSMKKRSKRPTNGRRRTTSVPQNAPNMTLKRVKFMTILGGTKTGAGFRFSVTMRQFTIRACCRDGQRIVARAHQMTRVPTTLLPQLVVMKASTTPGTSRPNSGSMPMVNPETSPIKMRHSMIRSTSMEMGLSRSTNRNWKTSSEMSTTPVSRNARPIITTMSRRQRFRTMTVHPMTMVMTPHRQGTTTMTMMTNQTQVERAAIINKRKRKTTPHQTKLKTTHTFLVVTRPIAPQAMRILARMSRTAMNPAIARPMTRANQNAHPITQMTQLLATTVMEKVRAITKMASITTHMTMTIGPVGTTTQTPARHVRPISITDTQTTATTTMETMSLRATGITTTTTLVFRAAQSTCTSACCPRTLLIRRASVGRSTQ